MIPALQAIVEDLFLLPSTNRTESRKELETQREVVVSVLLRLVRYPQVNLEDPLCGAQKATSSCILGSRAALSSGSPQLPGRRRQVEEVFEAAH